MTKRNDSIDLVAILLAIGISTALNVLTFAVVYDAVTSQGPGLSENATQILTGWGGGMIGVIGAFVGYRAAGKKPGTPPDPELGDG